MTIAKICDKIQTKVLRRDTKKLWIITDDDEVLKSQHAGYSDDEIYVPLIVIDKC